MGKVKEIIDDITADAKNYQIKEINSEMSLVDIIKLIAPGTQLRAGLDEILKGGFGAIIVLGTNIILESIIRGGFKLDITYSPQRIFELSKMDGASIISSDISRIVYSNIHLMPDKTISSNQTGIRHRSAQQTAKQIGLPVVAISQRRKIITLFYKDDSYVLQNISILLAKGAHSLRTLNNYRIQIDSALDELTYYELNNTASIEDAIKIIQKIVYMFKQVDELDRIVLELGDEGLEIKQGVLEYTLGLEDELKFLIKDYSKKKIDIDKFITNIKSKQVADIADSKEIAKELGLTKLDTIDDSVSPKGYRILSKIPKISKTTIEKVITDNLNLEKIYLLSEEELAKSCSDSQAKALKQRLTKLNEAIMNKIYKV